MLSAMISLRDSIIEMNVEEDREAIRETWQSAALLRSAMHRAIAPPDDDEEIEGSSGALAHELYRNADAYFACIETIANESDRRWRDGIIWSDAVEDDCIVCGLRRLLDKYGACSKCEDEYGYSHAD